MKIRNPGYGRVILALAAILVGYGSSAAAEAVNAGLAAPCLDFAFDPKSGRIAGVHPDRDELVVYDVDKLTASAKLEPTLRRPVGKKPASLVYKEVAGKRYFIIGCLGEANLYVVDVDDPKQVTKVAVTQSQVHPVAASSSPDDPYVYYCYGRGHDSTAGRVNLATLVDEGKMFEGAMDCGVSAKGNFLYRRGPWSPPGLDGLRKSESSTPVGPPTFTVVHHEHSESFLCYPDPFEKYTASGKTLYSASLEKIIANMPMIPLCFFEKRPLIAGIDGEMKYMTSDDRDPIPPVKLVIASYNTLQKLTEIELPGDFLAYRIDENYAPGSSTADYKLVVARARMFPDESRERIVIARRDKVSIVKFADLAIADEPLLVLDVDESKPLRAGRRNVVKLTPRDPQVKVELLDKFGDMAILPEGFVWTPAEDAIGERSVRVKLTHGKSEKIQTLTWKILRDGAGVPFEAEAIAVSPDGSTAVVWTKPQRLDKFPPELKKHFGIVDAPPRAGIVSLTDGTLIADGPLPFNCASMAVDAQFVYAAKPDSPEFALLDRNTFNIKRQISTGRNIRGLQPLDANHLLVCLEDGFRVKYTIPDLKVVWQFPGMPSQGEQGPRRVDFPVVRQVAAGLKFDNGDVFDLGFTKPRLVARLDRLQPIVVTPYQGTPSVGRREFRPGMSLESIEKRIVAVEAIPETNTQVVLVQESDGDRRAAMSAATYMLEVFEGSTPDRPSRTIPLLKGHPSERNRMPQMVPDKGALLVRGTDAYVTVAGSVLKVSFAGPPPGVPPLTFEPVQSAVVLDAAGKTQLKHQVVGAIGKLQFGLSRPFPGMEIAPADGTITVDGERLLETALDNWVGSLTPQSPGGSRISRMDQVAEQADRAIVTFQALAGRAPSGLPLSVPIAVHVMDSTARGVQFSYQTVLDVPREKIEQRLADLAKARAAAAVAPAPIGGAARDASTEARIQALERRIMALEAQLNTMTRILSAPVK